MIEKHEFIPLWQDPTCCARYECNAGASAEVHDVEREYTDLHCGSAETAEAVQRYLAMQLDNEEPIDRPSIISVIEKHTLRITYENVAPFERREWDMMLMGYRDGVNTYEPTRQLIEELVRALEATVRQMIEAASLLEMYPDDYGDAIYQGRTALVAAKKVKEEGVK